jgi:hypothetical protein
MCVCVGGFILLNHTPIFKWFMIRLVLYNGHQKDVCCNDIRLRIQDVDIILGLKVNTIDMTYVITIFIMTSSNICISNSICKLIIPLSVVCNCWPNCIVFVPTQQPKFYMELEVPTIGPHTYSMNSNLFIYFGTRRQN